MTCLVVCLSTGKGTWSEVANLIKKEDWDKIFLVTNDYGVENFKLGDLEKKTTVIEINTNWGVKELTSLLKKKLIGVDGDVALNFVSGSGKEHMAILAALLKLGVGIRLVTLSEGGIDEL